MIATANQYVITQDRIRRFKEALATDGGNAAQFWNEHYRRAIEEQIVGLWDELRRYDHLASGEVEEIIVDRLADLPQALIEARIVAGLDQLGLARATGQPLQHIERWERDGYSRVSLATMQQIASVLPLRLRGDAFGATTLPRRLAKRALKEAGLPREIFDRIIVPTGYADFAMDNEIERRLVLLFGAGAAAFASGKRFEPSPLRFKLPQNAVQDRTRAYAAYVDGLCGIVDRTQRRSLVSLPNDWRDMRRLLFPQNAIDFGTAVKQCWAHGIAVLGLKDSVAFHGACRRRDGRATIVLKQTSRHASRSMFDLAHELFHLVAEPADFTLLEAAETAVERRQSRDERRANRFAAMILTNGELASIFETVSRQAGGVLERLSGVVAEAARLYDIPVGILANLVAENVRTTSGRNWWGAAENLQPQSDDPWKVMRDVFIQEADLKRLGVTERALLHQVLETADG